MKFNQFKKEACKSPQLFDCSKCITKGVISDTDFIALGHDNNAWNVVRTLRTLTIISIIGTQTRSEFDKILLDHAESTGTHVFQSTRVSSLTFSGKRPISALWIHGPSSQSGTITFDYLVDASGRAGLMSNRYLKNRRFNASLKNVATWAYWRNTDVYARGTTAEGSPYFEALSGAIVLSVNVICTQCEQMSRDGPGLYLLVKVSLQSASCATKPLSIDLRKRAELAVHSLLTLFQFHRS